MQTQIWEPRPAASSAPIANIAPPTAYLGDGRDVVLQGFHWFAHAGVFDRLVGKKSWYRIMAENAAAIRAAGFCWVWFPPPSDSLAVQGYIPRRWNVLDSAYGTEAELRAAIRALGPVRAMADVVLNHRVGVHTAGADFADPPFPDNRAAIARDDESGVGTGNPDTGERHPAGRDLDHTNPGVRATIVAYLRRLREVGFAGWRYDLVKGYHGRYVAEYNDATAPGLSVGEVFDMDVGRVADWVRDTGGKSTAFDFPLRFRLFDALMNDDYGGLCDDHGGRPRPGGLLGIDPARAMTFLDNHDTEYRRENEHVYEGSCTRHFPGHTVHLGYAYLLTHPGVPCVFWSHYFDWGAPARDWIDRLIRLRTAYGLHARSRVEIRHATRGLYAAVIDGRVAVKLGTRDWCPGPGWHLALDGDRVAVWRRARSASDSFGRRAPAVYQADQLWPPAPVDPFIPRPLRTTSALWRGHPRY
jgi:alpha-amylase